MPKKEQILLRFKKLIKPTWQTFYDFLISPNCAGCGNPIQNASNSLCLDCWLSLPFYKNSTLEPFIARLTNYPWMNNHWSWCYYRSKLNTQQLVSGFKYEQNQSLAVYLGKILGQTIARRNIQYECIVPVPLHPKKLAIRGYNQAEIIAQSIADSCNSKLQKLAVRTRDNPSQTRLSNLKRWENNQSLFEVLPILNEKKNQRILLVDDIFTTGSTLVSLSKVIHRRYPSLDIDTATLMITV